MGVAQGVRKCRGRLCSRTVKRLHQLDTVAAWIRHATAAGCREFAAQVRAELDASSSGVLASSVETLPAPHATVIMNDNAAGMAP
eukprot:12381248-Prorocentrum_lima.AAC.1